MARPTLFTHRKLLRLGRELGSFALAVGHLEILWASANESGEPIIGDADDVEAVARWEGEPGKFASALHQAGGPGRAGFIDQIEGGLFVIHDYWDHAPKYVKRRSAMEDQRRNEGNSISEKRRQAAMARWAKTKTSSLSSMQNECTLHTDGMQTDATGMQTDAPPAPAPAPAPYISSVVKEELGSAEGAPPAPASGAPPRTAKPEKPKRPLRFDPRTVPLPAELDVPTFRAAWEERIVERGELGAKGGAPAQSQIRAQLSKLAKLAKARGLPVAVACVERAIEGRHQGIVFPEDFEERAIGGRSNGSRGDPSIAIQRGATTSLIRQAEEWENG